MDQQAQEDDGERRPISLYQSLVNVGWQPRDFGDAGPFPPYTRVGTRLTLDGLAPCFQSHGRRWGIRRARTFEDHFARFSFIKISAKACEDAFGPTWAAETNFPVDRWLRMGQFTLTKRPVWDAYGGIFNLPLPLLPMAGQVELA